MPQNAHPDLLLLPGCVGVQALGTLESGQNQAL